MPNLFCIVAAKDSHIEFLGRYPEFLQNYLDGKPPILPKHVAEPSFFTRIFGRGGNPPQQRKLPEDWPTREAKIFSPGIANTELYHRILNGSEDFVSGSGTIFQTWWNPWSHHSAITISLNEACFAFKADQIPELLHLVASVDRDRVMAQYTAFLDSNCHSHIPTSQECEYYLGHFLAFSEFLQSAIDSKLGIFWLNG